MIGLTPYERELTLPGEIGDPLLVLPSESELADLVLSHLSSGSGCEEIRSVTVAHVRYKPGVAAAATYTVSLADGTERAVTYRSHVGDKPPRQSAKGEYAEQLDTACAPLRAFASVPEPGGELWTFPADPHLPGIVRALNLRRTAHRIDRMGVFAPLIVRQRRLEIRLRRYKFKRRAVFHVVAKLRGPRGEREVRELGLRVLPDAAARTVATRRAALAIHGLPVPSFLGYDEGAGLVFESWLPGEVAARGDLSVVERALGCAAAIHAAPLAPSDAVGNARRVASLDVLARVAGISCIPEWMWAPLELPATHWVHGDLHPDQVILDGGQASLLDLDNLRPGAPEEDLASLAADTLVLEPERSYEEVEESIVAMYRSHRRGPVSSSLLRRLVALEIFERAASTIRRLERGAVERAQRLIGVAGRIGAEARP